MQYCSVSDGLKPRYGVIYSTVTILGNKSTHEHSISPLNPNIFTLSTPVVNGKVSVLGKSLGLVIARRICGSNFVEYR